MLYALACVLVPALWGVAMYYAFGFVDRRRAARAKQAAPEMPPADYSI